MLKNVGNGNGINMRQALLHYKVEHLFTLFIIQVLEHCLQNAFIIISPYNKSIACSTSSSRFSQQFRCFGIGPLRFFTFEVGIFSLQLQHGDEPLYCFKALLGYFFTFSRQPHRLIVLFQNSVVLIEVGLRFWLQLSTHDAFVGHQELDLLMCDFVFQWLVAGVQLVNEQQFSSQICCGLRYSFDHSILLKHNNNEYEYYEYEYYEYEGGNSSVLVFLDDGVDFCAQLGQYCLNALTIFCTGLKILHFMTICQTLGSLNIHFSVLPQIQLVSHQNLHNV